MHPSLSNLKLLIPQKQGFVPYSFPRNQSRPSKDQYSFLIRFPGTNPASQRLKSFLLTAHRSLLTSLIRFPGPNLAPQRPKSFLLTAHAPASLVSSLLTSLIRFPGTNLV